MAARRENRESAMRAGERRSNLIPGLREHCVRGENQNTNDKKDLEESLTAAQTATTSEQITWMRRYLQILFVNIQLISQGEQTRSLRSTVAPPGRRFAMKWEQPTISAA